MKPEFSTLYTPFEKDLNPDKPWDVYPRPQLKRESFINLNGKWDFKIECRNKIKYSGEITVPFPPGSSAGHTSLTLIGLLRK